MRGHQNKPHSCREDLNVAVAFKGMGIESDQEIIQMVGSEPALVPLFMPTLQECNQLGIHTQQQALEYMGTFPNKAELSVISEVHLFLLSRLM